VVEYIRKEKQSRNMCFTIGVYVTKQHIIRYLCHELATAPTRIYFSMEHP